MAWDLPRPRQTLGRSNRRQCRGLNPNATDNGEVPGSLEAEMLPCPTASRMDDDPPLSGIATTGAIYRPYYMRDIRASSYESDRTLPI